MAKLTYEKIIHFLNAERFAIIGASRNPKSYSRQLLNELIKHGKTVTPINPKAESFDGLPVLHHISQIKLIPERVILTLPEDQTEQAVIDCAQIGVKHIWLHRHIAGGVSDHRAIYRAQEHEIELITGYCMFMFLPKSPLIHRLHGSILRLFGLYPA